MTSQVSIVNKALILLGESTIISLDDNTKPARTMKAIYDQTRDAELRRNRWNFAMKRASLSALSDAPEWGYDYQYQLPSDCLRLDLIKDANHTYGIDIYREQEDLPFAIEGRRILTSISAPLDIRYVYQVTDTNEFDALFVQVLACRLAMETAEIITQSSQKKQDVSNLYALALRDATKVGAIEKPTVPIPDGSWAVGRL